MQANNANPYIHTDKRTDTPLALLLSEISIDLGMFMLAWHKNDTQHMKEYHKTVANCDNFTRVVYWAMLQQY